MMPPPSAAEVHGTNDYLLGFFVGKNAKKALLKLEKSQKFYKNLLQVSYNNCDRGRVMPIREETTLKEIVTSLPNRITEYNRTNSNYNKAYALFSAERTSGISLHKGVEGWLTSDSAGPSIMNLIKNFGMDSRGSKLIPSEEFISNIRDILPIPDPPKKCEIISTLVVLFMSKTPEMCSESL